MQAKKAALNGKQKLASHVGGGAKLRKEEEVEVNKKM